MKFRNVSPCKDNPYVAIILERSEAAKGINEISLVDLLVYLQHTLFDHLIVQLHNNASCKNLCLTFSKI